MATEKVLLVDDESAILSSLRRELGPWAAQNCVALLTATSAPAAIDIIDASPQTIAVVLSDVRMPEISGTAMLVRLRQTHPQIVSILLTGYADMKEAISGIKAGVFSFMLKPWNPDHLQAELGKALSLYRMRERERVQQKHLREELEWAGELQRTLFSVALPATDRLDLSASYRPLPEFGCGGDFYDVIRLGPEQHLILIGDVAGHGVRAALVSAVMRSLVSSGLTARASSSATPAGILGWLNRRLCLYLHAAAGLLVSCAACSIDAAAGRLVYSNAGHPPGLLLHGGRPSSLKLDGPPLGAAQDTEYHERAWTLEPGDHLVMYTDGLIDIDKGATSAGMLRLEQVLQTLKDGALTADSLVDGVLAAAGTTASDDIAALIVRLKPA